MPSPYIRLIPTIDPANIATCLACPLTRGCVYESSDPEYRKQCPIWRRETRRQTGWKREAWRRKRDAARAEIDA